jgi:hypothetical protein
MSMLEFPTFEEMVAVMNSPSSPPSPMDYVDYLSSDEAEMDLSTDEMIRETFLMVKKLRRNDIKTDSTAARGGIIQDAILMDNPSQS